MDVDFVFYAHQNSSYADWYSVYNRIGAQLDAIWPNDGPAISDYDYSSTGPRYSVVPDLLVEDRMYQVIIELENVEPEQLPKVREACLAGVAKYLQENPAHTVLLNGPYGEFYDRDSEEKLNIASGDLVVVEVR